MTELAVTGTNITAYPAAEPATVAQVRAILGRRRPPGARPGRRRPGQPDPRVDRLDLLTATLTGETVALAVLWLASTRRTSPATRVGYTDDLLHWAHWYSRTRGGPLDLGVLTRTDITLWLGEQQSAGLRPTTLTRRLAALSSLYRYAASYGLPLVCPITEDHRPAVPRGRHDRSSRVLTVTQIRAMYEACADLRDALVLAMLHTDGLRISELCAADVGDVTTGRHAALRITRKGGKTATLPLDPLVYELLSRYQDQRGPASDAAPMIVDATGNRIDRWDITRLLRRVARAAAIPDPERVTAHSLRATAINQLIEAGRTLPEVQAWAGHASLQQVMTYYEDHRRDERNTGMSAHLAAVAELSTWLHTHTPNL